MSLERPSLSLEARVVSLERLSLSLERLPVSLERLALSLERLPVSLERLPLSLEVGGRVPGAAPPVPGGRVRWASSGSASARSRSRSRSRLFVPEAAGHSPPAAAAGVTSGFLKSRPRRALAFSMER